MELTGVFSGCVGANGKTIVSLIKDPLNNDKKTYNVRTNILKEVFGYEGKKI